MRPERRSFLRTLGAALAAPAALLAARSARATPDRTTTTATLRGVEADVLLPILAMIGPGGRCHHVTLLAAAAEGDAARYELAGPVRVPVYRVGALAAPAGAMVILQPVHPAGHPAGYAYRWPPG